MTRLSERAMLSSLHISSYTGMMADKEVSEEVSESHKADKKLAGRYNKRLINAKFMNGVASAHRVAKDTHRLMTLPWEDDGTRILTTSGYIDYTKRMRECRLTVEDEVKKFVEGLPEYIEEAKIRLGSMFNAADYPTQDELLGKFGFDVEIKPVPEAGDFRAQLSDDQTKAIIKDIEKRSNARLDRAIKDVFERVAKLVEHMSTRLKEYQPSGDDGPSNRKIRDTLVYNIYELAEAMPALNVNDDPRIEELRQQLLSELVEHSPEILRTDAKVRKETITKADRILKKVGQYLK